MALFKETMLTLGTDGLLHSWVGNPVTPPPPPPPPPPGTPTARITTTLQNALELVLSASSSSPGSSNSTLTNFAWSMGDGTRFVSSTVDHVYAQPGIYLVTLTVDDSAGGQNSSTQTFTLNAIVPGDQPPVPSFVSTSSQLALVVDASGSTDPDGTITSYAWDFGDGGAAVGVTASHTYAVPGTYPVTLLVSDDLGSTNSIVNQVTISNAAPPVASLALSQNGMTATYDASASSDPSGGPISFDVDWGDGSPHSTGATNSHTYAAIGPWTVILTVTNRAGATATATKAANPTPAAVFDASTPAARDATIANAGVGVIRAAPTVVHAGDLICSTAGTYKDLVVTGRVRITASNVIVENVEALGQTIADTGMGAEAANWIFYVNKGLTGVVVRYSTAHATNPNLNINGFGIGNALWEHNEAYDVVDAFNPQEGGFTYRGNYTHDLYVCPVGTGVHADGRTHSDGIEFEYSTSAAASVLGNVIYANRSPRSTADPSMLPTSALMFPSSASPKNISVTKNWLYYGVSTVNMGSTNNSATTGTVSNNVVAIGPTEPANFAFFKNNLATGVTATGNVDASGNPLVIHFTNS